MGARFFCENCGAEVNRNSKSCPKCGRPFANIRCPSCGFVGEEVLFTGGCPVCGYTAGPGTGAKPGAPWVTVKPDAALPKKPAGPLPGWAYVLAVLALVGVMCLLLFSR